MHQRDKLYIHVKKNNLYSYEHIMKNKKILYVYMYIDWVYILIGESIMERI